MDLVHVVRKEQGERSRPGPTGKADRKVLRPGVLRPGVELLRRRQSRLWQ